MSGVIRIFDDCNPKDRTAILRIKQRLAGCSRKSQEDIRNMMISDLIETDYDTYSKRVLFEMIEYIRNLWS